MSKKGPKTGGGKMVEFWPWGPPGLQIGPRSREWVHKTVLDPKMTSKLSQNGTFWIRNHSNTSCDLRMGWNREGNPKVVSEKNWREFCPCRSHFFVAKRPHSTQRAREVSWKKSREFRLCTRLFFLTHRLHSTQQTRKLCQKTGEHSVHAHDCFLQCIGPTVHSEQREGSAACR